MIQQPPPGRRRRLAARSQEPVRSQPSASGPYLVCGSTGDGTAALRRRPSRSRLCQSTARPHAGPPSLSPAPGTARADVTSGTRRRRRRLVLRVPVEVCAGWSEAEAGVSDSTNGAGGHGAGGRLQASLGTLTGAIGSRQRSRRFLFLSSCFRDPALRA